MANNSTSEITRRAYNKIAGAWTEKNFKSKKITRELNLFSSYVKRRGRVLDAGCGSGRHTKRLIDKGYDVTSIDFSKAMLAEARKRVPEGKFRVMDILDLKFRANSFDGLWCFATFLHIEKEKAPEVLEGFRRVLKPHGILGVSVKEGSGQRIETNEAGFGTDDKRFFAYYTEKELRELVENAGFKVMKVTHRHLSYSWIIVFARNMK